jgi:hypothetical protein
MNALGLEYASSSDDEDAAHASSAAPASNPSSSRGCQPPVMPSAVSTAAVLSSNASAADDDSEIAELEAALARGGVPPAPGVPADPAVQERIAAILSAQRERDEDFQTGLQARKEVRNPYILDKVVAYFAIDELASNFDPRVFDPHALPLHEFSDALALEHKRREDARVLRQQQAQLQMQQVMMGAMGGDSARRLQFNAAATDE